MRDINYTRLIMCNELTYKVLAREFKLWLIDATLFLLHQLGHLKWEITCLSILCDFQTTPNDA